jgi:hypothetical protein
VSIPEEHVEWYRNRCGSGLHNTHTDDEWEEITQQAVFRAKFTAAPDYTLPALRPEPPVTPRSPLPAPRPVHLVPKALPCAEAQRHTQDAAALRTQAQALLQQAKTLAAQAKTEQRAARKAEHEAKQAEHAARKAEHEAAARRVQIHIVTVRKLDAYPVLRQALLAGGSAALDAFETAVQTGEIVVRTPKKAPGTSAPKVPRHPSTTPRTAGRVLTQEEIEDIHRRHAAGEAATAIGKVHGLHHVTVLAVISGRIKAKTA